MTHTKALVLTTTALLVAAAVGAAPSLPVIVSPGSVVSVDAAQACPTFSWAGVEGAQMYELLIYKMAKDALAAPEGAEPALRAVVPGAATSWTPAADRCLAGGTEYVWFVRAAGTDDTVGEWSEGAMFRTVLTVAAESALGEPATEAIADVPEHLQNAVIQVVERYLASVASATEQAAAAVTRKPRPRKPVLPEGLIPAPRFGEPMPMPEAEPSAFRVVGAATANGIQGISDSTGAGASGVMGHSLATEGYSRGVSGYSKSPEGSGVYGESLAMGGGVGVIGASFPQTDTATSSGVAGITDNENGFGGWFWNFADGNALVVADVDPVDIMFSVDVEGNVGLDGRVQFRPTDMPQTCVASSEGSIYYDRSEHFLCVCTQTSAVPLEYGWRRSDDAAEDCE